MMRNFGQGQKKERTKETPTFAGISCPKVTITPVWFLQMTSLLHTRPSF